MISLQEYTKNARLKCFDKNASFHIGWQITGECNFRCSYCYEHKQNKALNFDTAKQLIDKCFYINKNLKWWNGLIRCLDKNDFFFDFFGGECTLEIDLIDQICQYFIDCCNKNKKKYQQRIDNFKILLETNGSLLQTPKVKKFIDKWHKYLMLGISVDGSKDFHDKCRVFKDTNLPTWDLVTTNYNWVKLNYPDIKLTCKGTISPDNVSLLYNTYLGYKQLGFESINTTIGLGFDWTKEHAKILKEQYDLIIDDMLKNNVDINYAQLTRRNTYEDISNFCAYGIGTCGTGGLGIAIDPWGKLYTCYQFSPIANFTGIDMSIGDIATGITTKGRQIEEQIINSYDKYTEDTEKCHTCTSKCNCEWCPAFAFNQSKEVSQFDHKNCEMTKIETYAGLKYMYLKEKKQWQNQ